MKLLKAGVAGILLLAALTVPAMAQKADTVTVRMGKPRTVDVMDSLIITTITVHDTVRPPAPPATPTLTRVTIGPDAITLAAGENQFFLLTPTWSDGQARAIAPTWKVTGGTMASGLYTAGTKAGSYRVIGTASGKADTAIVTISVAVPPTPPDTSPTIPPVTPPPSGANSAYFNSAEAGCGTDPNVVWCDDFEDGDWYTKNCDKANASGGLLQTDGWCGTIYADAYISGAVQCGGKGAASQCAAYSGQLPGPNADNTGNMGDHGLGPNNSTYGELWFRWYILASSNHTLNPQKTLTINATSPGSGGISIAGFGNGAGWASMCPVQDCNGNWINPQNTGCPGASNYYLCQNQGNDLTWTSVKGHWVYQELHIKMNTAGAKNGLYELWMNDCGVTGVCSGSPVLRSRFTNVQWTSAGKQIQSFWVENQSPPDAKTTGTEWYDQIKVSKAGPIGFVK